jgi:hypothetical protein
MDERRTFNTPIREPWNAPIHNILKAIDNHTKQYLKTEDPWHEEKANMLREYLHELKTWIHKEEGKSNNGT